MNNTRFEGSPAGGPIYRIAEAIFIIFVLLPIFFVQSVIWHFRIGAIEKHIVNEDMDIVVLREANRDLHPKILSDCEGLWNDKQPVISLKEGEGKREWFRVDQSKFKGPTPVAYIEKHSGGVVFDSPIYAAFAGPDAIKESKSWLKLNGYSNPDFKLEVSEKLREKISTWDVAHAKGESQIRYQGIFETFWGYVWLWNGSDIESLTGGERFMHEFSGAVQDLVLPMKNNLYRSLGIAWVVDTFWKLFGWAIVLAAYGAMFTSIGLVLFTGRKFTGPRPSRLMLTARLYGTFYIIVFLHWLVLMFFGLQLDLVKWLALVFTVLCIGVGVPAMNFASRMDMSDEAHRKWRAAGGRPYWDTLRWPVNPATEIEKATGIAEPDYTNFVPPDDWIYQCPKCGVRVQYQRCTCWNCGYGSAPSPKRGGSPSQNRSSSRLPEDWRPIED